MLALLNRPRLVILDELTQGLDPAARRDVWAAVRQLHDDGTTVLLVTHEMDEAEALCDRVVVMRAGRVLDAGHAGRAGGPARAAGPRSGSACRTRPQPLLDELGRLDGVREVERAGARVTVHGDRRIIAHVGAGLVRRGTGARRPAVHVPSLEDALLSLLRATSLADADRVPLRRTS